MLKDQFAKVLDEFADLILEDIYLDDNNTASFMVDEDIVININYLEQSDSIVIFSPVGSLGEIGNAGKKAEALLKLNDIGCDVTGQVTLMLDPEIDLVLAADCQSALSITSKDELSAWIEVLVKAVRSTREYFAEHFPLEE
ncbi:type III secretion system chaperone [Succinivibrio dextrinosolvens]|jgi:hypothetical protein|uniref:type III secretion system chaperone n=1 Tax=Succinivibrio dextrinosolvens TaxID=83771 RepID=UPI00241EF2C7|nr:type III secretion system chaperone [Succinivibrio dextrinosolvens]MBE6424228.1 type III secretion system chaperone [Succinivibrio dextrinosolvens]